MPARPDAIVDGDWLAAHAGDPDLRLIHAGVAPEEFDAGHLRGAVYGHGYDDFTTERGGIRALVPDRETVQATLRRLGVDDGSRVVFYASAQSPWPSRGYWVLRYYGFEGVHIAARSLAALTRAGLDLGRLGRADTPPSEGNVKLRAPDATLISTHDEVLAVAEGGDAAQVIDCRTPEEWRGLEGHGHEAPRYGRVPRAVHLNWELLVDEDGAFLPLEQMRALYTAAGIDGSRPVFPYCGGGIRSAVSWLVMHELFGWDQARNYDGSWAEWSRMTELPVEQG